MTLTPTEKLIWAATYAAEWSRAYARQQETGIYPSVPTCIEDAWTAVTEAREAHEAVRDGWGEDDAVYLMLKQMTQPQSKR